MPNNEPTNPEQAAQPEASKMALTVLQSVQPPHIPDGAEVKTVLLEFPPGDPGTPPHRHPGPVFGYMLEGEMLLEVEGRPERVVKAGESFWEQGGDVIHYQDRNNRQDAWSRFVVTMVCPPGEPLLTLVDAEELARRSDRRSPRPA
jgi:quercetin dioxygenase-like cupin family protein